MKAAYPFIDDFLPAGTLASLEQLGHVLAGGAGSSARRGSGRDGSARRGSAITHATSVAPSLGLAAPDPVTPAPLGSGTVAADRARPLT